jgi:DNA invertase Pin-like site-specific DNA recombinase
LVDTLIVDEDGIYNPRQPNDRLLLGMKGTMSEMELSVFRQRSIEAIKQKAQRAELFRTVAIGYLKTDDDRIEKDPDRRVQDAIALVFHKFGELQSVRPSTRLDDPREAPNTGCRAQSRQAVNRVEVTGVPRTPSHPDEPGL